MIHTAEKLRLRSALDMNLGAILYSNLDLFI